MKHKTINRHQIPFQKLIFRPYPASPLKTHENHPVSAIDTESYHGEPKLIADSFGNYLLDGDIDAILSFLTRKHFRKNHIFAYNLQYDAESVLKMLPDENITNLIETNNTDYRKYHLKYIPKKLLTIRDPHRNTTRLFDIAQFFETSLDTALKKYLNLAKTDYPHRKLLNTSANIWKNETPEIIQYCLDDAHKTALLAEFLQSNIKKLFSFNPRSYISKASLAKDLVRIQGYVPNTRKIPLGALRNAFYAYKGGRFEVCQRGYFPDTELYDLNSAYASTIRNLVDITSGQWRKVTEMNTDCQYGFYLCSVFVLPAFLCPITYILPANLSIFPAGQMTTYLTKDEIIAYEKHAIIKILHGWEFYVTDIQYPFQQYMDNLFAQKQQYEKTDYKYDLVKKMMNSLYGCFYEKNPVGDRISTGILFNPIYASIATANARIKLFETAKKYEKSTIAMATDSILFDRCVNLKSSDKMGEWKLETKGKATVLQTGVYLVAGKIRTRGIQRALQVTVDRKKYKNIFTAIKANPEPTIYTISQQRPCHLRECIARTKTASKEDINIWHTVTKTIDVNRDLKRVWTQKFRHGGDIFTTAHQSQPWHFYSEK